MPQKIITQLNRLTSRQRIIIIALIVIIVLLLVIQLKPPARSVAAYCSTYKAQAAKIPHKDGDKYRAGIFTSSENNPKRFAEAYSELERVSPDEIRQDVRTLSSVFEKIDSDPSQTFSASISGLGAEANVKEWTSTHCK